MPDHCPRMADSLPRVARLGVMECPSDGKSKMLYGTDKTAMVHEVFFIN
jgi:hypothetical protein